MSAALVVGIPTVIPWKEICPHGPKLIEKLAERQELLLSAIQVINDRLKALLMFTAIATTGLANGGRDPRFR